MLPKVDPGEALARFERFLRDRRLPVTRQRREVLASVLRLGGHPSVERLQRDLAERQARVGTATIYRTLDLLVESGLVREHDFGEGFRRYEAVGEELRHEHLICQRCGQVVEFSNERLERMIGMIADEMQFLHRRHRVEIYGLCAGCRRRDLESLGQPPVGRRTE